MTGLNACEKVYPWGTNVPWKPAATSHGSPPAPPSDYNRGALLPAPKYRNQHVPIGTPIGNRWPPPLKKGQDGWGNTVATNQLPEPAPPSAYNKGALGTRYDKRAPMTRQWTKEEASKQLEQSSDVGALVQKKSLLDVAKAFAETCLDEYQKIWWTERVNSLLQLQAVEARRPLTYEETLIRNKIEYEITVESGKVDNLAINQGERNRNPNGPNYRVGDYPASIPESREEAEYEQAEVRRQTQRFMARERIRSRNLMAVDPELDAATYARHLEELEAYQREEARGERKAAERKQPEFRMPTVEQGVRRTPAVLSVSGFSEFSRRPIPGRERQLRSAADEAYEDIMGFNVRRSTSVVREPVAQQTMPMEIKRGGPASRRQSESSLALGDLSRRASIASTGSEPEELRELLARADIRGEEFKIRTAPAVVEARRISDEMQAGAALSGAAIRDAAILTAAIAEQASTAPQSSAASQASVESKEARPRAVPKTFIPSARPELIESPPILTTTFPDGTSILGLGPIGDPRRGMVRIGPEALKNALVRIFGTRYFQVRYADLNEDGQAEVLTWNHAIDLCTGLKRTKYTVGTKESFTNWLADQFIKHDKMLYLGAYLVGTVSSGNIFTGSETSAYLADPANNMYPAARAASNRVFWLHSAYVLVATPLPAALVVEPVIEGLDVEEKQPKLTMEPKKKSRGSKSSK